MTLTRREKGLIIMLFVVAALAAYVFYFFIPYVNNTSDANKRLRDMQMQVTQLKAKQTMAEQLQGEIDDLNNQLKSKGAAVPVGIDHARILLYLKKITDGRTEDLDIKLTSDQDESAPVNPFAEQKVTMIFKTTYSEFLAMIGDLKKNELFSGVSFLSVTYATGAQMGLPQGAGSAAGTETPSSDAGVFTPPPTPTSTPDKNVLSVNLELTFYAMQPTASSPATQAEPPAEAARTSSLMPEK